MKTKTVSQQKQEQLFQLLQANNLQLSIADLIEFTYHQWENDYLTTEKLAEHISYSRNYPINCLDLHGSVKSFISLGRELDKAQTGRNE